LGVTEACGWFGVNSGLSMPATAKPEFLCLTTPTVGVEKTAQLPIPFPS
jgi:hypothetical protein